MDQAHRTQMEGVHVDVDDCGAKGSVGSAFGSGCPDQPERFA
jgi:hypothetical protein